MSFFTRLSLFSIAIAGCAPVAVTEDEVVPIYESPCDVFDAGADACNMQPDENGSYVAAWSSLSCMDVCDALNTSEPHPVMACEPMRVAMPPELNAGFNVVTCTFDEESGQ